MAKLDDVLNTSLREIKDELKQRVNEVRTVAKEAYQKSQPDLSGKIKRIEKINQTILDLNKEKDIIESELKNADPSVPTAEHSAAVKKYGVALAGSFYSCNVSDIEIAKAINKSTEIANLVAFETIERQIINQFNLAVTNKQKQQVIFNLQSSIDWKSLGINLPNMFEASKVEIKNGTIIIDNALPNNSK